MVQHLAGDVSVTTIAKYDRYGEVAERKAVKVLHFPCAKRGR